MERRVLLAVFLSFIVLYAYQALLVPRPAPLEEVATADGVSAPAATSTLAPDTAVPSELSLDLPQEVGEAVTATLGEAQAREIVVDIGVVEAIFSNQGARLTSWRLRDHLDSNGDPLDLVPPPAFDSQPTPFMLRLDDPALSARVNQAVFRASGETNGRVDATTTPVELVFEYADSSGLTVRKTFGFEPDSYVMTFSAEVTNGGQVLNPAIEWGPGLSVAGATGGGGFFGVYDWPPEGIYFIDDGAERVAYGDIPEAPVYDGAFRFVGVNDHYFVAAALDTGPARVEYAPVSYPVETGEPLSLVAATFAFETAPDRARFFFGPKQFDLLQSIDGEFVRAIYFGIFAWLVVPLLGALNWIHGFVGNYGWSIVLLTILINLVIFPLRHKSVVSMRKMQTLQPRMKAIQERYKNLKVTDPARQKMNTEIMNLYREEGVNPASGCVPMLLTMPVLFAFYSLLSAAIELRNAPFTLWIQDLSLPDPYYVTPLLMGVTMFWQQKITPTTVDPTQQKVMMLMPLMFVGFMVLAPSGLVIYWFVSNLWMIGQQYFTNWLIGPPRTTRPPAERRLKKVGEGRAKGARVREKRSVTQERDRRARAAGGRGHRDQGDAGGHAHQPGR